MCGEILISRYLHDFKACNCSNVTCVDGGRDYKRRGGVELGMIQEIDPSGQRFPNADGYVQPRLLED
jgi:hypothetical protein